MAKDKPFKKGPETEFIEKLFGNVMELSDEELDLLYQAVSSGTSPAAKVHELAEQAAMRYRKQNKVPPDHVRAFLKGSAVQTLQGAKTPILKKIVAALKAPVFGPVADPAYSYRNLKNVTERDKTNVDELEDELNKDWKGKEA